MTWLITGGAGYIGAHVVRAFRDARIRTVVVDDLTTGRRSRVPDDVPLLVGSVRDPHLLRRAFLEHQVEGVVHCAGKKQVAESVADPLTYYRENVEACQNLLQVMVDLGVPRLLFSSSAAVYGDLPPQLVREDAPTLPLNPYGWTKLVCEQMIREVGAAHGLSWIALRYFNVSGTAAPGLADTGAANLIPLLFEALEQGKAAHIFGADYPTPDGTCIRDFIHVADLAVAHIAAARHLASGQRSAVFNVGRGEGASVREVLRVVEAIAGADLRSKTTGRRPGDAPEVVADAGAIQRDLGWHARLDLTDMVQSVWAAWPRVESAPQEALHITLLTEGSTLRG